MKPEVPTSEDTDTNENPPIEHQIDLDNLPKQTHNFIKRGIVISCEGAGHTSHRHFLVKR